MACRCKERDAADRPTIHGDARLSTSERERQTTPADACLYCAEKHIATAAALARELGYSAPNRGYVVGELVAACWHLAAERSAEADALAADLRDFRHKIQSRQVDESATDLGPFLERIDALISAAEQN